MFSLGFKVWQIKAKSCGIIARFVNDSAACPVVSGADQFFLLSSAKELKYASINAPAIIGTSNSCALTASL